MRMLVVDDEVQTVLALAIVLDQAGHLVWEAGNGAEALDILAGRPAEAAIDLMLLDLHMPVMDGFQVLARLDSLGSDLPVVVMTGYAASSLTGLVRRRGHLSILHKPFSADLVLPAVAEAMASIRPQLAGR
jgi:CheY-like chemotaxis protein